MQHKNSSDNTADKESDALFNTALQHYQQGRLPQAEDLCQRILGQQQRPDAILILANIAQEQKRFEVAIERYKQFLGIVPQHAQSHFHIAVALEEMGRTEAAIEHYKKSIAHNADNAEAHSRLADACYELQRWEEAIASYQQVLALQGEDVGAMIKLGSAFNSLQLFAEAIVLYERILTITPDNALVYKHLGASLQRMGRIRKAVTCFEQALRLRPDYVGARIDLARALRTLGEAEKALTPLDEAIDLEPENEEAHMQLAATLRQLGQTQRAIECLEGYVAIRPACGEAYHRISVISPDRELIAVIEKLLGDPGLLESDAIYCHFALGNLFDASKAFDRAFSHFLRANEMQRATFTYDADESRQTVTRLTNVYSNEYFSGKPEFGSASQLPVFIVGMPRSGTTLIEQILSSHPLIHGAGEIESLPAINRSIVQHLEYASPTPECMSLVDGQMIREYSERYLQDLAIHSPTATRITDKFPQNFFSIGLIKTLFPDARIVHCRRDPIDNCMSLFFHYFKNFKATFDLAELAQYYLQYQRLMSYWQDLFPGQILTVQYEELVVNQEGISKEMIDYLGVEWDEKCLDFHNNERNVLTPSNLQVKQPMYATSVGRWKNYERQLQPLVEAFQETR